MSHANNNSGIAIAILAKAPIPGLTKTRLIPYLGADGAATLQDWLLRRTVATALNSNLGPVTLWCAPDTAHPAFVDLAVGGRIALRQQREGNLGERMHQALAESPMTGGTLVIGTECPALGPAHLQAAAAALAAYQAVVIPAEDGGYVLIGMRQPSWRVFTGINWGSAKVMTQTRERLLETGRQWSELPSLWDVDREEDFERLGALLPDDFLPGR